MEKKLDLDTFSKSWDIQVRNLWPESYPIELSEKLKSYGVKTVLDCAGGTGYPSIELKEMGWDVSYSDGAEEIQKFFLKKIKKRFITIPNYLSKWENLTRNIPDRYDALLCSGNSFLGIAAYNNSNDILSINETLIKMKDSLQEFYNMINTNGVLFIDMPKKESLKPLKPYVASYIENNDRCTILEIVYDSKTNIRTTREISKSLVDNKTYYSIEYKIYPISSKKIISLMLEVGFKRVEKSTINTANYVDAFFAFK